MLDADFIAAQQEHLVGAGRQAGLDAESDRIVLAGDGVPGQALGVVIEDAATLFAQFRARGLDPAARPNSPIHQGPTEQTWGTIEFYVDDPDGNTLRFIERGTLSDADAASEQDEEG